MKLIDGIIRNEREKELGMTINDFIFEQFFAFICFCFGMFVLLTKKG